MIKNPGFVHIAIDNILIFLSITIHSKEKVVKKIKIRLLADIVKIK